MASLAEAFAMAVDFFRVGEADKAETLCRRILAAEAESVEAWHLLGTLRAQAGDRAAAAGLFRRATLLAPAHAGVLGNLAAVLDGDAAPQAGRRALRLKPSREPAAFNHGILTRQAGRLAEARAAFRLAAVLAPAWAEALHALGETDARSGQPGTAVTAFLRAARLRPESDASTLRAAAILGRQGVVSQAESLLCGVLARRPDRAEARFNLAGLRHESGRLDEAAAEFRRTLALTPGDAEAWCGAAAVAKDAGRLDAAVAGYRRALTIRPAFEEARLDLGLILSRRFPAWHFTMLADGARNRAYAAAIAKAVTPGARVLEIGTGAGLLALLAARAGAGHVWTCEMSPDLAAIARGVVADNGYADRVTVLTCRSTELRVGRDLPEPADVLISEILDGGLLGEGAASTIAKAVTTLARPGARVIPKGAVLKAMAIESPALRATGPIGRVEGFDLSRLDAYRNPSYRVLPLVDLPHRPLGEPVAVAWIDLRNPPPPGPLTTCTLPLVRVGTAQAVAFWFDLHLDDEIVLSTGPEFESRHWQQAVQLLDADHPVVPGQGLPLDLRYVAGRLMFYPHGG